MERRVLIALVLSFLVLYVYQTYVVKPVPKPAPASTQAAQPGASLATVNNPTSTPPGARPDAPTA